ncbi:hypothetical protein [Sphingomonas sp. PAMC 26617]|uniref:hypothetical protein n=1 Tax=Sphingomonas sp. PAMC 26617 TaxID=1112216 RepID=UPI000289AF4E|nr:hypothetical protein [Sphingomonas sp. PAMC 26617]
MNAKVPKTGGGGKAVRTGAALSASAALQTGPFAAKSLPAPSVPGARAFSECYRYSPRRDCAGIVRSGRQTPLDTWWRAMTEPPR